MKSGTIEKTLRSKMKDSRLDLIAVYFDALSASRSFVSDVDHLTKNEGGVIDEYLVCYFPKQLDEYQLSIGEGFDGIEFSLFEDKISVDVPTFRKFLKMACEVYWTEHPETRKQLEEYLARPQPPLEEGTMEEWRRRRDAGEYPKPLSDN